MYARFFQRVKIQLDILTRGVSLHIASSALLDTMTSFLASFPKSLIKGLIVTDAPPSDFLSPQYLLVDPAMSRLALKRALGRFVFHFQRWPEQEVLSRQLLAQDWVPLGLLYQLPGIHSHVDAYERVNADVFALQYGKPPRPLADLARSLRELYASDVAAALTDPQRRVDDLLAPPLSPPPD